MCKQLNPVIVIGASHHNTLGVIRSLGYCNIYPYLILIAKEKKSYVAKSKYIKNVFYLDEESDTVSFLLEKFKCNESKPIIIACYDSIASVLDSNNSLLSPFFLLPGARCSGQISKYMNKRVMIELAQEIGLECPKSYVFEKSKDEVPDMPFPWILKPLVSKEGSKQDIKRCYKTEDFEQYLQEEHCNRLQIQQLIDKDYEFQLIGVSMNEGKQVVIPGYSYVIRPSDVTNTGFLKYIPASQLPVSLDLCKSFLCRVGYTGLFSMEFIHGKDGKNYFMEINFRNDGNAICVTASGLNLPYIYCLSQSGLDVDSELKKIQEMKPVYVMPEFDDIILLLKGKVNIFTWLRDVVITDCFMEFSKNDMRPFFYELSNFITRAFRFVGKKLKR
jgi:predicted ATP-grasp superfamily ATP-dependent carboligase